MLEQDSCRLAFVGEDGDVYQSYAGAPPQRLTWGWNETPSSDRLYYVLPSYAPDGAHLACFGIRSGSQPRAGLYAVADDGVRMHEIWQMTEAAPVCESWSPDSQRIALLLQNGENQFLEIADVRRPGQADLLETGSSLYWSWSPQNSMLAVHSGGSAGLYEDARLTLYNLDEGCRPLKRLKPGEFRTPAWSPDAARLAYVDASDGDREFLALYRVADGTREILRPVEGHTAMMWSPDGSTLAYAEAAGDSPYLFAGISLIDVADGSCRRVHEEEVASFFWRPDSSGLLSVAFDERQGMRWSTIGLDGSAQPLGPNFYPSRELVYFCWFFDQFAASHPVISPDGSRLVFAGHMPEEEAPAKNTSSSVYVASVTAEGAPLERVAAGRFACWDGHLRAAAA